MDWLPDAIDERIERHLKTERRLGFYRAAVDGLQSLRRGSVAADFGAKLRHAQRISSPLLDVIPAIGTTVAVLSRDGIPERPAILGALWDDVQTAGGMTAWLRANLEDHPGHVELGATDSITIKVGSNAETVTVQGNGKIYVGDDNVEIFGALSDALGYISSIQTILSAPPPGTPVVTSIALAGDITALGLLKTAVDNVAP